MSNSKISALPSATTPLAGTEVLPVVQGGITEQVSVANLTAGRDVSASGLAVDANSATAAVRITQLGAGNAILIEDSTSPDSSPFVIDASGDVGIGTTTPTQKLDLSSNGTLIIQSTRYSTDASEPAITLRKARGTGASPSIVSSGDTVTSLNFQGYDGADFLNVARIIAQVDGTPGTNDMPGRLIFSTTADGASSSTERLRIASDGLTSLQNSSGLSIARTAVTSPATTDGNVFSGTYTPTLFNTTNVAASTASILQYSRVGNYVQIAGRVAIDPTAVGAVVLGMSIPVASALTSITQAGGTFSGVTTEVGYITADAPNDRLTFNYTAVTTTNNQFYFTAGYQVL
jgi:hypothetical protein